MHKSKRFCSECSHIPESAYSTFTNRDSALAVTCEAQTNSKCRMRRWGLQTFARFRRITVVPSFERCAEEILQEESILRKLFEAARVDVTQQIVFRHGGEFLGQHSVFRFPVGRAGCSGIGNRSVYGLTIRGDW